MAISTQNFGYADPSQKAIAEAQSRGILVGDNGQGGYQNSGVTGTGIQFIYDPNLDQFVFDQHRGYGGGGDWGMPQYNPPSDLQNYLDDPNYLPPVGTVYKPEPRTRSDTKSYKDGVGFSQKTPSTPPPTPGVTNPYDLMIEQIKQQQQPTQQPMDPSSQKIHLYNPTPNLGQQPIPVPNNPTTQQPTQGQKGSVEIDSGFYPEKNWLEDKTPAEQRKLLIDKYGDEVGNQIIIKYGLGVGATTGGPTQQPAPIDLGQYKQQYKQSTLQSTPEQQRGPTFEIRPGDLAPVDYGQQLGQPLTKQLQVDATGMPLTLPPTQPAPGNYGQPLTQQPQVTQEAVQAVQATNPTLPVDQIIQLLTGQIQSQQPSEDEMIKAAQARYNPYFTKELASVKEYYDIQNRQAQASYSAAMSSIAQQNSQLQQAYQLFKQEMETGKIRAGSDTALAKERTLQDQKRQIDQMKMNEEIKLKNIQRQFTANEGLFSGARQQAVQTEGQQYGAQVADVNTGAERALTDTQTKYDRAMEDYLQEDKAQKLRASSGPSGAGASASYQAATAENAWRQKQAEGDLQDQQMQAISDYVYGENAYKFLGI